MRSRPASAKSSKKSEIDENLFGYDNKRKQQQLKKEIFNNGQNQKMEVIQANDFLRIKGLIGNTELEQQKQTQQNEKQAQMTQHLQRKEKIIQLEKQKHQKKNNNFMNNEDESQNVELNRAKKVLSEQNEDCNEMKKMVNYALCVTVRDKQLQEKRDHIEEEHQLSLKKDMEMELIRLQNLKYYKELEQKSYEQKKLCQNFVIDQINQKGDNKLNKKKQAEKEYDESMQLMAEFYHDEAEDKMIHKRKLFLRNQEIYEDNQNKMQYKNNYKQMVQKEEQTQQEQMKQRIQKKQQDEDEQQKIKKQKEIEIFKMGSQQQQISDKQKQLELLIEKRQQESIERRYRQKEHLDSELKAKKIKQLWNVRNNQVQEKKQIQREQAQAERDEYQQNLQNQEDDWILECKLVDARQQLLNQNLKHVKQQMVEKDNKNMIQNRDRLEESKKVKNNLLAQKDHLEKIKKEKLKFLQDQEIDKKYMSELSRKKIFGVS